MRNLDESPRFERDKAERDRVEKQKAEREGEVVSFEQRTASTPVRQPALLPKSEIEQFLSRWNSIQAGFVDDPRRTLEEADKFVSGAIERIEHLYLDERGKLEGLWREGDSVSTEDMRIALQRYRAFFTRLMSM